MVGSKDKYSIFVPRLLFSSLKKQSQVIVRIANTFMNYIIIIGLVLINVFITFRYNIWMMRTCSENSSDKWLFHLTHIQGIELQELFIPNSPHTIKVFVSIESLILIIFGSAKISVILSSMCKCFK